MRNAGLEEAQAGIKIAGRTINNLRYADDTTLMAESKEELKSLLMKVKEEDEKVGLKLRKLRKNSNLRKLRSWHPVPSFHGKWLGNQWKQWQTLFLGGSKLTTDGDCSHEIKRHLLLGRKVMTNLSSVQFSSVAQSCPTLCDPMNCSTPGLPVHHQLPESTQTHVHWVGANQTSLSSPSPPAPNPSQHQGLFKWISFSHQVAKV